MAVKKKPATAKKAATKPQKVLVRTSCGQISFPFFAKPDTGREFSDDRYKLDLLFKKSTWKEEGKELRLAIIREAQRFFEDPDIKSLGQIPKHPIKDGDEKDPEKPASKAYAGCYYIHLKSDYKPTVLKPDGKTEMTAEEIESIKGGDYARCVASVYGYSKGPNSGVGMGLQLVQFWKEGEAFGGGSKAASMELLSELEIDLDDVELGEGEEEEEESEEDEEEEVSNVRL